ncbi:MAG: hypothetical protein EXR71_14935 [Myxococcales bacterium]|nr:hypothetical protein [Myxococcales bacterium]
MTLRPWRPAPLLFLLCGACAGGGGAGIPGGGVVVNGDTYEARALAAWREAVDVRFASPLTAQGVKLDKGMDGVVAALKSKVAVDVPEAVRGLPEGTETVDLRDPRFREALLGTDENALADALRDAGAKLLVVHRNIAPSFDRDRHILSRLYHHGHLDRFQLHRVEDGVFVYLVPDKPLTFEPALADAATRWLRRKLSGEVGLPPFLPVKADRGAWTLVTSIRGQGRELAFSLAEGETLDLALEETADDLETRHRRHTELLGFPPLSQHIKDLTIEMRRVKERAYVVPRSEAALASFWEMGLDGAILLDKLGDKKQSAVYPGAVSVSRGLTTAEEFLRNAAFDMRWDSFKPWRDEGETTLELIRTLDYREVPDGSVVAMYRGTTQMPLDAVSLPIVKSAIIYAGEWWLANLQPDGTVTYKFWPEENRYSDEYNHVRHELATWNLWQAWTLDPRPEFMEGAIRAQDWTLRALVERDGTNLEPWEKELVDASPLKEEIYRDGMAYLTYAQNTKLGSAVVGLFGMVEVARATGDHSNDELMRKLGRYVMMSQLPAGNFRPYHVPPDHPYRHEKNDIVPGEAALSLVYLYEYFQDPQYLKPLESFFEYYKPWFKTRAEKKNLRAPWPVYLYDNTTRLDLVQFGPWTVMAANAYTRARPDREDVVDFGLEVARWMVESYEFTTERAPFPDYVGGYYKFEGELPAMQAFCYGEGTAAAYQMALRKRPEQAAWFEKATRETVRIGIQMQHDRLDSFYYPRPELVEGGVRYALNEPKVRQDYTYHAQSTFYQWYIAAKDDLTLPESVHAEPSAGQRRFLKLLDMPGFRDPGAPYRTSLPRAEAGAAKQGPGVKGAFRDVPMMGGEEEGE